MAPGRINFQNGWAIDIHEIRSGEVYFQRWPPGVESQGMFDNLYSMGAEKFWSWAERLRKGEEGISEGSIIAKWDPERMMLCDAEEGENGPGRGAVDHE